jgi:hypothetical protein
MGNFSVGHSAEFFPLQSFRKVSTLSNQQHVHFQCRIERQRYTNHPAFQRHTGRGTQQGSFDDRIGRPSDFGTHSRQNPKTLIDRRMGALATAEWLDPGQLCNPDCDSRLYFPFPCSLCGDSDFLVRSQPRRRGERFQRPRINAGDLWLTSVNARLLQGLPPPPAPPS